MRSLRIRLLLMLGVAIVVATAVQFASSFRAAMQEANDLFDYHMEQMALALQDSAYQQPSWYKSSSGGEMSGFDFVIQIWTDDGVRVYQSRTFRSLPERGALGYSNVTLDNGEWRLYGVQNGTRVIQVAQKLDVRRDRAISFAIRSLWQVIPVSLLLFAAAWWVVSAALAPLNRIGGDLAKRNADSLDPVDPTGVPQEVSPLVAELNSLLARMALALQSQQRFVADAAHELRSPLTALKLQVQTLARARDETARGQAVARLLGGVDRASRLVEQLLALARQDPLADPPEMQPIALTACIEQAAGDVAPVASARQIRLEYGEYSHTDILGDAEGIRILVRNLLDNAVRYAPEHGLVRIDLTRDASCARLTVQDSGSGIPEENRARIFDRFYRVPGTSPSGSGLGLAIVKAIADRHDAQLALGQSRLGGLAVTVSFPLPQQGQSGVEQGVMTIGQRAGAAR
ncbi:MAG TPA: ATP-binding protein [Noviherbaspirillum sp.]|uniref:ATP-binding protein n=1 Tax=Noviherbaspirillum sp. TaxID=1926288 RepID=UPI002D6ED49B|nr:ATP-binding protein [Noviherbaspirillum sp.]HYD95570.1 ATP-binding protein [Noviherbaspirillum sp.]